MTDYRGPSLMFTLPVAALNTRTVRLTTAELAMVLDVLPRVTTSRVAA